MATSPFAFPLGVPIFRWFDNNGLPAASYQLQTYAAGTATPLATYPTYADAIAGTNPNTNPVVLDANGAAQVWVQAAFYKLVMMLPVAAGGATVYTQDNVPVAMGSPYPQVTEWVSDPTSTSLVTATSFLVNGVDATATYHAGRRIRSRNLSGLVYSTVRNSSFAVNTTVNVVNDSGAVLDGGFTDLYYGLVSYNNPSYLDPRSFLSVTKNGNQTGFAASTKVTGWTVAVDALSEWVADSWLCKYPGKYRVMLAVEFADTGVSIAVTPQIKKNAALVAQAATRSNATASNIQTQLVHYDLVAAVNDTIEAYVLGSANTTVQGTIGTRLSVVRVP